MPACILSRSTESVSAQNITEKLMFLFYCLKNIIENRGLFHRSVKKSHPFNGFFLPPSSLATYILNLFEKLKFGVKDSQVCEGGGGREGEQKKTEENMYSNNLLFKTFF